MSALKNLTQTAKYMLLSLLGLFVALGVIGVAIILFVFPFEGVVQFVLGLFSGCFVSAIRLILMDKSIEKSVEMQTEKAKNYSQLQFFIRYFITIIYAIVLVVFSKYLGVFGGVIGLFCLQISAYIANYILNRRIRIQPQSFETKQTDSWTEPNEKTSSDEPEAFDDSEDDYTSKFLEKLGVKDPYEEKNIKE